MDKKKILLIIMIIIVIIIIVLTVILLYINIKQDNTNNETEKLIAHLKDKINKVENKNQFFNIDMYIKKYFNYKKQNDENAMKAIFVNKDDIKADNFQSKEMYLLNKITNYTVYVKGISRKNEKETDNYLIVNLDYVNYTFSIVNSSKDEYENAKNNIIDLKYKENIIIENNQYNDIILSETVNDFEILKIYFEDYKYKALYNQEVAFNLIDNNYRQEKFENDIGKYKEYIEKNKANIQDANIVRHGITKSGQFCEYICIDNYNNYYKFSETGINSYTVILDNYTLETDELVANYNKLTDKEKVSSNIDKVMKLINEKSYKIVYNYLNKDFKNNYFKTQGAFEEYIKTKFFDNNILGAIQIEQEGNIYIVTVPYKESLSSAAEEETIIFYVKLGEETNFELSFNME